MISVVIAARDEERALARSLAALVPAAVEGVVLDVLVIEGGSADGTRVVAEAAGCRLVDGKAENLGEALRLAARRAKAPWLLFLRPGVVLDPGWTRQASDFIDEAMAAGRAEARAALLFGRGAGMTASARMLAALARLAGVMPRGGAVLLSAGFYASLGGHRGAVADISGDLARRIGRRRLALLRPPAPGAAY